MRFNKSMRTANKQRTICEVIRELYWLTDKNDKKAIRKLRTIHNMAKRMAKKLYEYNKEYDKDWWKENSDYDKDIKSRLKRKLGE